MPKSIWELSFTLKRRGFVCFLDFSRHTSLNDSPTKVLCFKQPRSDHKASICRQEHRPVPQLSKNGGRVFSRILIFWRPTYLSLIMRARAWIRAGEHDPPEPKYLALTNIFEVFGGPTLSSALSWCYKHYWNLSSGKRTSKATISRQNQRRLSRFCRIWLIQLLRPIGWSQIGDFKWFSLETHHFQSNGSFSTGIQTIQNYMFFKSTRRDLFKNI